MAEHIGFTCWRPQITHHHTHSLSTLTIEETGIIFVLGRHALEVHGNLTVIVISWNQNKGGRKGAAFVPTIIFLWRGNAVFLVSCERHYSAWIQARPDHLEETIGRMFA